jgi:hypothetical protein
MTAFTRRNLLAVATGAGTAMLAHVEKYGTDFQEISVVWNPAI